MKIQELILNYLNKVPVSYQLTWLPSLYSAALLTVALSFEGEWILLISMLRKNTRTCLLTDTANLALNDITDYSTRNLKC